MLKNIQRAARVTSGLAMVVAVAFASSASPVFAEDRPPLPDPLPCPVDAPIRVASTDTVRRFTALADCGPDGVVVAALPNPGPRNHPNRIAPLPIDGAQHYRASHIKKGKIGDTTVETGSIGASGIRVVRIMPVLPEEEEAPAAVEPIAPVNVASVGSGLLPISSTLPSDSAILAMRPASFTTPYDAMITRAAARHRVDPLMLHSVIKQESAYRPGAVSRVGARGLMQIMPGTGSDLGVSNASYLMDPATNIDAGARLLKKLWGRLDGRFDLVLAAYNAGEGAVRKYGMRVPPYAETQNYVSKVQSSYFDLVAGR
jgi:hypothetical protein